MSNLRNSQSTDGLNLSQSTGDDNEEGTGQEGPR